MHHFNSFKLLSFLLMLLVSHCIIAQDTLSGSREDCKSLIQNATKANSKDEPIKALEYLSKAQIMAEKNKWTDLMPRILTHTGLSYHSLSDYGEALGYYKKALELAKSQANNEVEIIVLNNMGLIYRIKNDISLAFTCYLDAYEKAKATNSYMKVALAGNIAGHYINIGDPDKAIAYLDAVRNEKKSELYSNLWSITYADALFTKGDIDKAKKSMDSLFSRSKNDDVNCYTCMVEVLTKIYAAKGKTSEALTYANKGLRLSNQLNDRLSLYNEIARVYERQKDFEMVSRYKDSVLLVKDSLTLLSSKGMYEANKVKLKIQEYQNELITKTEKHETQRNLFIGGIFLVLVVSFTIYRGLKHKITRQTQEKIIFDNRQKIVDLELEGLKNSIAEKNRNLSAKTLYLLGRNELIGSVINSLSEIPEISKKSEVSAYIKTLNSYIKTDGEWDEFITYFEQVNPQFLKVLQAKHPQLTAPDIRFLCYIYMNLDIREIGAIFNITYNAAVKRQYRIKEKMKIDRDAPLYEYLLQLV